MLDRFKRAEREPKKDIAFGERPWMRPWGGVGLWLDGTWTTLRDWRQRCLVGRGDSDRCTFCRIIGGAVDSTVVFADEVSLAFLDHRPIFPGHCLIVPKEHHETIRDLPEELVGQVFLNARWQLTTSGT